MVYSLETGSCRILPTHVVMKQYDEWKEDCDPEAGEWSTCYKWQTKIWECLDELVIPVICPHSGIAYAFESDALERLSAYWQEFKTALEKDLGK